MCDSVGAEGLDKLLLVPHDLRDKLVVADGLHEGVPVILEVGRGNRT